jgi:transcription initiation factor IIE alpha subunit
MVRILADAPVDGLSLDEIREKTLSSDDPWSLRTVNDILCDLRMNQGVISCHKIRVRQGKITKYFLKVNSQS